MIRDLESEVNELRRDLGFGFQRRRPNENFQAIMTLALVQLSFVADRFKNSQCLNERRNLIREYDRGKEAIRKGIQMLYESPRPRETETAPRRAMP
jgi:hypothetical protein